MGKNSADRTFGIKFTLSLGGKVQVLLSSPFTSALKIGENADRELFPIDKITQN